MAREASPSSATGVSKQERGRDLSVDFAISGYPGGSLPGANMPTLFGNLIHSL